MRIRKKKLVNPVLQLRIVAIFLCTAGLAVQIEAILIAYTLTRLAGRMPNDGAMLLSELPEFVRTNLLLTFALLTPLTLAVGIVATFKIAGPIHRFERYLSSVIEGKQIEPCTIRKGDELQHMCALINDATAPLRARSSRASKAVEVDLEAVGPAMPSTRETGSEASPAKAAGDDRTRRSAADVAE
jgi:hypothetical protein